MDGLWFSACCTLSIAFLAWLDICTTFLPDFSCGSFFLLPAVPQVQYSVALPFLSTQRRFFRTSALPRI